MRCVVLIGPVDPSWTDDIDGQVTSKQCPHLYRPRVGPEYDAAILGLHEQGVLHRPRRMIRNEVEGIEVHPLSLELWTLGHLPAHRDEDVLHQAHQRGNGIDGTERLGLDWERDIDSLLYQDAGYLCGLQLLLTRSERLVDHAASPAHAYAGILSGLRRQRADLPIGERDG